MLFGVDKYLLTHETTIVEFVKMKGGKPFCDNVVVTTLRNWHLHIIIFQYYISWSVILLARIKTVIGRFVCQLYLAS